MGRTILLLTAAAGVALALALSSGARTSAFRTAQDVADHAERVLAREIALTGHGATVTEVGRLVADGGVYTGPGRYAGWYQGGTYISTVEDSGDDLTVVTRGSRDAQTYVIRARYVLAGGEPIPVPPPFMASAIFADNTLDVTQPVTITSLVDDMNVNVHSNGHLRFLGGSFGSSVSGFGTHRQHFVANGGQGAEEIFIPVFNPDGLPLTESVPRIHRPGFTATEHQHLANGTLPGWISGTIQLGTPDDPAILYVNGNLRTEGPVQFLGYGLIIVNGNTDIYHDISAEGGNDTRLAIYGGGHIRFRAGGLDITGHLLADGNMTFDGDAVINGGITAGNLVDFNAPITVNYRPASCTITEPLYPDECYEKLTDGLRGVQLLLVDYREGG